MRSWLLELPYETPPRSLNDRRHWQADARLRKNIRDTVRLLTWQAGIPRLERINVTLIYTPRRRCKRDIDNLIGTLKPAIDGTRDYAAGGLLAAPYIGIVADDDPTHVTWDPPVITVPGPGHGTGRLFLKITEVTE